MRILSVVGKKDSGKTSLTVRIIKELKNRNYKVASIKHSHHQMEMDHEGTDTYKHKQAGSNITIGIGTKSFFNIDGAIPLERLLFLIKLIDEPDFVVIEGFKNYNYPKIVTSEELVDDYCIKLVDAKNLSDDDVKSLVNIIENKSYDILPTLFTKDCGHTDSKSIAKAIINGDLDYEYDKQADVTLSIDGKVIGLNDFVNKFLKETILGMLKSLKTEEYGVKDFDKIEILINNKK
ncbi:MAG: molybdopterin-guanine dinucleotide biosynthesis protein B [Methanobrevibacter wolinii]|nr:molybdopterin-guanine dinucleotide biosynthesis protein B [Methanobrevibacter wolinii]